MGEKMTDILIIVAMGINFILFGYIVYTLYVIQRDFKIFSQEMRKRNIYTRNDLVKINATLETLRETIFAFRRSRDENGTASSHASPQNQPIQEFYPEQEIIPQNQPVSSWPDKYLGMDNAPQKQWKE